MTPPSEVLQGDSYSWDASFNEYLPVDGWTVNTVLRAPTGPVLSIAGAPQPNGSYRFTLSRLQTASLVPGHQAWVIRASMGDNLHTLGSGRLTVNPSLLDLAPAELGTVAAQYLAALEAIGPTIMATGYAEMELDGGHVVFRTLKDYSEALKFARGQVLAEASIGKNRVIRVHFSRD